MHEANEDARTTESGDTLELCHHRFGHLNAKALKQMAKQGKVKGMPITSDSNFTDCKICIQGKPGRDPGNCAL